MIPIIYHKDYQISLSRKGALRKSKYAALYEHLTNHGVILPSWIKIPSMISYQNLARVHAQVYLDKVFNLTLSESELRRIGLARIPELVSRPRTSSGGTLLAARYALKHAVACNLAGGSHHAHRDFGAGFCVFNDVAVAAQTLLDEGHVKKILVVDLDVHQGDGTAAIFANNPDVYTFSIHCGRNFPVRKAVSDLDIALESGVGDDGYLDVLEKTLPDLMRKVQPDLIFYLAGVDPHKDDKLGHLMLSDDGLRARENYVLALARGSGLPVVTIMGGGYGDDRREIARRHAMVIEEAVKLFVHG